MKISYFSKNAAMDDEAKWWSDLQEVTEFQVDRPFKDCIVEDPYEHTISLDLDVRVRTLLEMIATIEYNPRFSVDYLIIQTQRLAEKCVNDGRIDLATVLEIAVGEIPESVLNRKRK